MATSGDQNFATTFWFYGLGLIYDTDGKYYLEDGSGNTRFTANSSGSKSTSANYDPFGNIRSSSGILPKFQFSKQQLDEESNLYFLRARYYDSNIGRFISKDPVKGPLSIPQSQNPYTYALNNPINLSDPSGEAALGLCVSADAGLGVYGTCSLCLQLTSDKQVGITFTAGGGGTTGVTLGGGGQVQVTNANNLKQISGQDVFAGGSARFIPGGRLDVSKDSDDPSIWGASANLGLGASANFSPPFPGGEFHGGSTYTWTLPLLNF
jgi:RHS repeat-associated protein